MGGPGSGRWNSRARKKTTENQLRLDIHLLSKKQCLSPGVVGSLSFSRGDFRGSITFSVEAEHLTLNYWCRPPGCKIENIEQKIEFDRTSCNYGNFRTWLLCPKCLARSAVLYCVGRYFLCRRCCDLTYKTQKLGKADRLLQKARRISHRLGGSNNLVLASLPRKPPHMHFTTYWRLCRKLQNDINHYCGSIWKR
jgi:hypothetical protein